MLLGVVRCWVWGHDVLYVLWLCLIHTCFFIHHQHNTNTNLSIHTHNTKKHYNRWAGSICELDIMYQLEQVHFLLDEMVQNGYIAETNKGNILRPLDLMEREAQKAESMYR